MRRIKLVPFITPIIATLIIVGCTLINTESDSKKQLKKIQVALKDIKKADPKIARSRSSYEMAMVEFEKTLDEGEHKRGLKYLFIDLKHVQNMSGVNQVFHQPVKERGPAIEPDRPWENDRVDIWSAPVWSDDKSLWQMWYWGGDGLYCMYAESADGINWEKPDLSLVEWEGNKNNNIINLGFNAVGKENRIVIIRDEHEPDPLKRFKGITRVKSNLKALVSPDGLNWTSTESDTVVSGDEYRLGYDKIHNRFIVTAKSMSGSPIHYSQAQGNRDLKEFGRRVDVSFSDDFVNWSKQKLILWGDEEDQKLGKQRINEILENPDRRKPLFVNPEEFYTDIYNMAVFTYEDLYLGLPMIFNQSGKYSPGWGGNSDGILYPALIASRDKYLQKWDRLNRQPFIPLSGLTDKFNYDYGMISSMPPVNHNDKLWFFYNGSRYTHLTNEIKDKLINKPDEQKHAIFLARLRVDGFASLFAGNKSGTILTVPVRVTGPRLFVNVDAGRGKLLTEILDAETRKPIKGYSFADITEKDVAVPVCVNKTSVPVKWIEKTDLSELLGRKVLLHFSLENAHLYSFWFNDL